MSGGLKCERCDSTIHGDHMIINGEVHCIDCAEDWMFDELMEIKHTNRMRYIQAMADALDMDILEVN